jgi:hypothetical protein
MVVGAAAVALLGGAEGGGCKADREVPVEVVRGGAQCGGEGEGISARVIRSEEELRRAFPAVLGGEPGARDAAAPDFTRELVLLVSAGRRPTAGHALELARPTAPVKGKIAAIQVKLSAPERGAMTAQVTTSPCLVVKLPGEGIAEVKVADQEEKIVASVEVR